MFLLKHMKKIGVTSVYLERDNVLVAFFFDNYRYDHINLSKSVVSAVTGHNISFCRCFLEIN